MRPNSYGRASQEVIRFRVNGEVKEGIQIYALKNNVSLQKIYEDFTNKILEEIKKGGK